MRKIILAFIIIILCFGCTNKRTANNESTVMGNEIIQNVNILSENKMLFVAPLEGLNLRSEPSVTSERIKLLPQHTGLTILERSETQELINNYLNYWYKVNTGEEIGWVFGEYLTEHILINYIRLTNCTLTTEYQVPNIINIIFGINDDEAPFEPIQNNNIQFIWGGFQILLRKDVDLNNDISLVAKNSKHYFSRKLDLQPIKRYNFNNEEEIIGYYENVTFENKFWLSDGNNWELQVLSNNETLIYYELPDSSISFLLFDNLDETPFISNNLRSLKLYQEYTLRSINDNSELIVIYYNDPYDRIEYDTYKPILYLIPNKINSQNYFDIGISWNDDSLKGMYYFGIYKINDLPTREETYPLFDSVQLQ